MDARLYFRLADSIASAATTADLHSVEVLVRTTEMHSIERHALERALRSRLDALGLNATASARAAIERAD